MERIATGLDSESLRSNAAPAGLSILASSSRRWFLRSQRKQTELPIGGTPDVWPYSAAKTRVDPELGKMTSCENSSSLPKRKALPDKLSTGRSEKQSLCHDV